MEDPPLPDYPYGFGTQRTLQQFWEFAGINPETNSSNLRDDELCKWPGGADFAAVCEPLFLVQDELYKEEQECVRQQQSERQQSAAAASTGGGS